MDCPFSTEQTVRSLLSLLLGFDIDIIHCQFVLLKFSPHWIAKQWGSLRVSGGSCYWLLCLTLRAGYMFPSRDGKMNTLAPCWPLLMQKQSRLVISVIWESDFIFPPKLITLFWLIILQMTESCVAVSWHYCVCVYIGIRKTGLISTIHFPINSRGMCSPKTEETWFSIGRNHKMGN